MTSHPPLGVSAVMLPELSFEEQVALCREHGVSHYSLRPRQIAEDQRSQPYSYWGNHKFDLTPQGLVERGRELRAVLQAAGMTPFGTTPAATSEAPAEVHELNFLGAAEVGAGRVRINPQAYPREPFDYEAALQERIRQYRRLVAMARPLGLKIVFETHSRTLATGPGLAWNLCRDFEPAELGVIFDLPNFAREGAVQPVLAVAVLGPWIDHCHVGAARRVRRGTDAGGFERVEQEFCALTEGDLHLPTWLAALRQAGVHGPLVLEDFRAGATSAQRVREGVAAIRKAWAQGQP